ncbi:MAG: hypothetical protein CVV05_05580 [Gammaproteobacteria bacterium HGW-Gammaproteobacteria-1]|jgi:CheY-like chemotaxis protein|nr:MAG: hypothetical protein CVV05_05580 [Gammaproteobacteria bacterium HGW-Gammaproteobacteria-1]
MSAQRRILLARPHPFIAASMKGLLEKQGYAATPLASLDEIDQAPAAGVHGAVISTSITAAEPAENVLRAVHRLSRDLPVVIATLLDFEMTRKKLEPLFAPLVPSPLFVPVTSATLAHRDLGRGNLFVVVHKSDLEDPARLTLTGQILSGHFR